MPEVEGIQHGTENLEIYLANKGNRNRLYSRHSSSKLKFFENLCTFSIISVQCQLQLPGDGHVTDAQEKYHVRLDDKIPGLRMGRIPLLPAYSRASPSGGCQSD